MYPRRPKKFRHRPNGRNHPGRLNNGDGKLRLGSNSFSEGRSRNHFITHQSAEKLVEKYNSLAKEALSSGDKILSENYFQHADHFIRIIDEKNLGQNKIQIPNKPEVVENSSSKTNKDSNIKDK